MFKSSFSVTQLLERIGEVVEQNHLFAPEGPTLGEELESLQQHLESLSSAQAPLENGFNTSHGLDTHTFINCTFKNRIVAQTQIHRS